MALISSFQQALIDNMSVSFAAGGTVSTVLETARAQLTALVIPSSWTEADISFYGCQTPNGTFIQVVNFDNSPLAISNVVANTWLPINPQIFNSIPYLQIVSSMAQASALVVPVMLAPIYQGIHG